MNESRYILKFNGETIATGMDLKTAVLLAKACAREYYKSMEMGAEITIKEEERIYGGE